MKDDIERTEVALAFPLPPRTSSQSTISLDDVTAFIQAKVKILKIEGIYNTYL